MLIHKVYENIQPQKFTKIFNREINIILVCISYAMCQLCAGELPGKLGVREVSGWLACGAVGSSDLGSGSLCWHGVPPRDT